MKFSLDAGGAQAAGQGLGSIFKAYALGPKVRQQAEQAAMLEGAKIDFYRATADSRLASARKDDTEAAFKANQLASAQDSLDNTMLQFGLPKALAPAFRQKLSTGNWGPSYEAAADGMGPIQPPPVNDDTLKEFARTLALTQRVYGTGSNVQQGSAAALNDQTGRFRDQAAANVGNLDLMNRFNTLSKEGATYTPFDAVGNTGVAVNKATGQGITADAGLRKWFDEKVSSEVTRNNGAASNSFASGALDREKLAILKLTGSLPGSAGSGEDATNAKARNAVIAAVESDMPGATDEVIQTEVDRRMARRGLKNSPAPAVSPSKIKDEALAKARAAIQSGAPRDKVIERLKQNGIDPTGL